MIDSVFAEELGKWPIRYLQLAKHVASWSKDPNKKIGAVIVGRRAGQLAVGYNGPPPGLKDEPIICKPSDEKNKFMLHAELNALFNAAFDVAGGHLFTLKPLCRNCAMAAAAHGISRVYQPYIPPSSDWADDNREALVDILGETCDVIEVRNPEQIGVKP